MKLLIGIYRGIVCYTGMTLNGLVNLPLYILSAGKLRRLNAEVFTPLFSQGMLFLIGIKIKKPAPQEFPARKVMYMFNHNSFLDAFIIGSLGIPKTRFILSTRMIRIPPLYASNVGLGTLFIPFKDQPEKRLKFLKDLSVRLQNTDDSILCAPEGVHRFRHSINKFNKGVFHAAMESKTPICPLFFKIPESSNPLETHFFKAGTVSVEIMPLIEIKDWTHENLEENIEKVRKLFVEKFNHEFQLAVV